MTKRWLRGALAVGVCLGLSVAEGARGEVARFVRVQAESIAGIRYEPESRLLTVLFKTGEQATYEGVPVNVWNSSGGDKWTTQFGALDRAAGSVMGTSRLEWEKLGSIMPVVEGHAGLTSWLGASFRYGTGKMEGGRVADSDRMSLPAYDVWDYEFSRSDADTDGKGFWNLRDDFGATAPNFRQHASNGAGRDICLSLTYQPWQHMGLVFGYSWLTLEADHGSDVLTLADGSTGNSRLAEVSSEREGPFLGIYGRL